jgi:hypothetical protein
MDNEIEFTTATVRVGHWDNVLYSFYQTYKNTGQITCPIGENIVEGLDTLAQKLIDEEIHPIFDGIPPLKNYWS